MRQILIILGLLLAVSCNKDKNKISISGLYTESSPVAGRSQLNFINSNLVVKGETGSNYKDTFRFLILTEKILLTPTWAPQAPGQQYDFEKIDDNTFKIENFYSVIPEAPKSYMTFKK